MKLDDMLNGKDKYDLDALDLPVEIAGLFEWNYMEGREKHRILGGMLRNLIKRTVQNVPIYKTDERWQKVRILDIEDIDDITELPVLSKDPFLGTGSPYQKGINGFRQKVLDDPFVLVPKNLTDILIRQEQANPLYESILQKYNGKKLLEFGSGGSKGKSTKTILTYLTIEMEAQALARCLTLNGFKKGQSIACFYNADHKGGLQLERAADIMQMEFHPKNKIFGEISLDSQYKEAMYRFIQAISRNDQHELQIVAPLVRKGMREYIRKHKIQVIESVQPPSQFLQKNTKGNALAFMTIYKEDPTAFESVNHVFLTGFPVPQDAYICLREDGKQVSTTWGSTETMALATYVQDFYANAQLDMNDFFNIDERLNVNDLTATPYPTVGVIAQYRERGLEKPKLERIELENYGLLLVTSLLGGGSTYINYLIGDIAVRTKNGYRNINRASTELNIAGSCAEDALSINLDQT